jgi:hypothetical protein
MTTVEIRWCFELVDHPKRPLCDRDCTFLSCCPWGGALNTERVPKECPGEGVYDLVLKEADNATG